MLKKILVTSLVAIGAVSCAYNRPTERTSEERSQPAPAAPSARPMGEGEMETPGIDSAPDPMSPDAPVMPESGSDENAPDAPMPPSGVPSADPSGGMGNDDILSPADDSDAMTPGELATPPDAMTPTPDDTGATDDTGAMDDSGATNDTGATDDTDAMDDGTTDGTSEADKKKKKKNAPGRGEGEPETDGEEEEPAPAPGDAEIDG